MDRSNGIGRDDDDEVYDDDLSRGIPLFENTRQSLSASTALLTARAKLPDDLGFEEYAQLIDVLRTIIGLPSADDNSDLWLESTFPQSVVVRVQYGSEFLVMIAVGSPMVLGALYTIAKIVDTLADAGLKNEQRRLTKQQRQANMQAQPSPGVTVVLAENGIGEGKTHRERIARSIARLGRYSVRLHIDEGR